MCVFWYRAHFGGSTVGFWSERVLSISDASSMIGRRVESLARYSLVQRSGTCSTWRPADAPKAGA